MYNFDNVFKRYEEFNPLVPVWCLTPNEGCYTHRFFDTVPISPSGKYLAVLNMPYENKEAQFGDEADVVLINLLNGEEKTIAKTKGWQHQMGANINWGENDEVLIYNDVDMHSKKVFAVKINPFTGEKTNLSHDIYHVSPNGKYGVCSNLAAMGKTQYGYGATVPESVIPLNDVFTENDGIWVTNISDGTSKLILSLKEIFEKTHSELELSHLKDGICYVFHTKWSPNSEKIMFSTRWAPMTHKDKFDLNASPDKPLLYCVYTCNADGSELEIAVDESQWCKEGHHTTWYPDSSFLTMNLNLELKGLKLCKASLTGRHVEKLIDSVPGSGHPSFHKSKNIMISDAYANEDIAYGDGTVPIRVIDFDNNIEKPVPIRINVAHEGSKISAKYRVDPHVVWDKTGKYCVFNGHTNGCRRVFIADMSIYVND